MILERLIKDVKEKLKLKREPEIEWKNIGEDLFEEQRPIAKGQIISECLFDVIKFSKKPTKNLTNFCPESKMWSNHQGKVKSESICYLGR